MKKRNTAFLYVMLGVPIALLVLPTAIVLAVALVPTGVAFIMERGKGYYGGITVGAMNLAGTAPYLADLWTQGHTLAVAVGIITNVFAWMMFYGAALFGWAIYSTTPSAVSAFMTMTAGNRIAAMRAQQRELVMKWGPDVESVYEPEGAKAAQAAVQAISNAEPGAGAGAKKVGAPATLGAS